MLFTAPERTVRELLVRVRVPVFRVKVPRKFVVRGTVVLLLVRAPELMNRVLVAASSSLPCTVAEVVWISSVPLRFRSPLTVRLRVPKSSSFPLLMVRLPATRMFWLPVRV